MIYLKGQSEDRLQSLFSYVSIISRWSIFFDFMGDVDKVSGGDNTFCC